MPFIEELIFKFTAAENSNIHLNILHRGRRPRRDRECLPLSLPYQRPHMETWIAVWKQRREQRGLSVVAEANRKGSHLLKQLEGVALCCGDGAVHGVVGFSSSGFVLFCHLQKKQEVIIFIFLLSEERMLRMAAGCR